jgi:nitroreductase
VSEAPLPDETTGPELPVTSGPSDAAIREAAGIAGGHRVSKPGDRTDLPPADASRGRSEARPSQDFWEALYHRRTTRRFDPARPVPREIVLELLDAALIAPTSCNLQMWDFVVVDDPDQRERLGRLSLQVLTAPVTIFVAYGKEYSEEGHANVQSAAAALMNMSLAAHVLGIGTFWINQLGPRDQVGRILGLPEDREVVAGLAIGWPAVYPTKAPRRRPFEHVVHWNHFGGRPIPSSPRPSDWGLDLIRDYQHARVLNGNRYNKSRPWELEAALAAADRLGPRDDKTTPGDDAPRWLDVLPVHGLFSGAMARQHRDHRWAVLELSQDVAEFAARRCPAPVRCEALVYDETDVDSLPTECFERVTVLNRLEALPAPERQPLHAQAGRASPAAVRQPALLPRAGGLVAPAARRPRRRGVRARARPEPRTLGGAGAARGAAPREGGQPACRGAACGRRRPLALGGGPPHAQHARGQAGGVARRRRHRPRRRGAAGCHGALRADARARAGEGLNTPARSLLAGLRCTSARSAPSAATGTCSA